MANGVALPEGATPFLRFEHAFGFDDTGDTAFDGGVLEFTTEAGPSATWQDIESLSAGADLDVGYNGAITTSSNNPIEGRAAFVQESHGYRRRGAKLAPLAGESVRFRWRIATNSTSGRRRLVRRRRPHLLVRPAAGAAGRRRRRRAGRERRLPGGRGRRRPTAARPPGPNTARSRRPADRRPDPQPKPNPTGTLASARVRSCKLAGRGRKARLRCTLRSVGAVTRASVTVKKGRKTVAKKTRPPERRRRAVVQAEPARCAAASYKVTLVLRDASGGTRSITKTLRVR